MHNTKITITKLAENAINLSDKKETVQARKLIAFKNGEFKELACVRWYMGRAKSSQTVYCSLWIWPTLMDFCASGHGVSSGAGYCKQSDSFERALNSAGIYSGEPISGRGISSVDDFLFVLAKHAGHEHVYVCHG